MVAVFGARARGTLPVGKTEKDRVFVVPIVYLQYGRKGSHRYTLKIIPVKLNNY
jgi:hypothetical protein